MKKKMIFFACLFIMLTLVSVILLYSTGLHFWLPAAITFGTFGYHFAMRLAVGYIFNIFMKNKADFNAVWFREHKWEKKLYQKLKVKKWKGSMPTFDPKLFDPRIHTWNEIAGAMCQAELVHVTIAVLSFIPIIAGIWFGSYPVFIITSIIAAMIDLTFVILQRYNRPRIVRIIRNISNK